MELGCKWVQAPDGFLWHRRGPDWRILSQTHIKVELPGLLACQTPTNPQLSYLAKCCWSNFTTFPTLPCSHSCWKRCICKICTCCTFILLISSCPVGSSIINETPTNLSSCHCNCAKPRMSDEKKADSMHVWFEKLT